MFTEVRKHDQKTPQMSVIVGQTRLLSTYGTSFYQFLSNAYIWLKLGSYINVMQNFKQSDNDIQIWMTESDNIIEKVRFSDVSS